MAKKLEEMHPAPPLFFADQPAALMLGPQISRISFGVEDMDDGQYPRPVVEIAIPTLALLQFVNDVKDALNSTEFKQQAVQILGTAAKSIATGRPVKGEEFEKVQSARKVGSRKLKTIGTNKAK
ncbi:MAG: hypothetical protein WC023_08830 [Rhodocyclaceae bacterium]